MTSNDTYEKKTEMSKVDDGTSAHGPDEDVGEGIVVHNNADHLKRRLGNRQIQLIAIGGSIGTGLFVNIGVALNSGGPASLLLAFIFYCCIVALVNNCMAEMITLFPVAGGFIRLAGAFVDDAFGFMAGWNFFLYQGFLVPFEISALSLVVTFWSDAIPAWAVCLTVVVLYGLLNCLIVSAYGESEFWLSSGKVVLVFIIFFFTFITMVGGNPQADAYGFRYWRTPGGFAEHLRPGALGRFEGFLAAMFNASFTIVGPEYLSMVAAESKHPRVYLKAAYKTIYFRFGIFFIGSAIACGVAIPYNDPTLVKILRGSSSGSGTAQASPYVIAMQNMAIDGLPHLINALLVTSIFSAGNTYVYCAARSLYGMSLVGRAPKFLRRCNKGGVPVYCLAIAMCFSCLSFLQSSSKTSNALNILVGLTTSAAFVNYVAMSVTYVFYHRAKKAQGLDQKHLPYKGYFQPYCGYISVGFFITIIGIYGYTAFLPWDTFGFFSAYTMPLLSSCLFVFWKVIKKTKLLKPYEVDLVWERPIIDAYEAAIVDPPIGFWKEMLHLVMFRNSRHANDKRTSNE